MADLLVAMNAVLDAAAAVLNQQQPDADTQEARALSKAVKHARDVAGHVRSPYAPLPEWLTYKLPGVRP